MKWYTSKKILEDDCFKGNISNLIGKLKCGDFSVLEEYYTLPMELTEVDSDGRYGFVMNLIDRSRMTDLKHIWYDKKEQFRDMDVLFKACQNLSNAFAQLNGFDQLTFTDLNEDGVFFNVDTGDVILCDCDNIVLGEYEKTLGRSELMAPELIRDIDARPSRETDLHSLGVLLFEMIFGVHPYHGTKTSDKTIEELEDSNYYAEPEFIFGNDGNECISSSVSEYWNNMPSVMKNAFSETLDKGIKEPQHRVKATEWVGIFSTAVKRLKKDESWKNFKPPKREKRKQEIIFVVDTSTSMRGEKEKKVNDGIIGTVVSLKDMISSGSLCNVDTLISILTFDDEAKWLLRGETIDALKMTDEDVRIRIGSASTKASKAFMMLDDYLDYSDYHGAGNHRRYPLIILISDGKSRSYRDELMELRNNICFSKAKKVSIGLKDSKSKPDVEMLDLFSGNSSLRHVTDKIDLELSKLICNLSVSYSRYNVNENETMALIDEAKKHTGDN